MQLFTINFCFIIIKLFYKKELSKEIIKKASIKKIINTQIYDKKIKNNRPKLIFLKKTPTFLSLED